MNLLALRFSCLSSCSYIKPQLENSVAAMAMGCLSSCSYIKPQRGIVKWLIILRCLSSCSYIKPQPVRYLLGGLRVVYHLVPTSNHNRQSRKKPAHRLFIILFLHQTTTKDAGTINAPRCLSSCSYIKPQPYNGPTHRTFVVYHLVPTSNHNKEGETYGREMLFIILFLHQTTTLQIAIILSRCCLSSCSYIKPQPAEYCSSA